MSILEMYNIEPNLSEVDKIIEELADENFSHFEDKLLCDYRDDESGRWVTYTGVVTDGKDKYAMKIRYTFFKEETAEKNVLSLQIIVPYDSMEYYSGVDRGMVRKVGGENYPIYQIAKKKLEVT